jgi:hypothetical protein
MALINCPECNKEISDKAGKCPNCGFPLEIKEFDVTVDNLPAPNIKVCPSCKSDNTQSIKMMCLNGTSSGRSTGFGMSSDLDVGVGTMNSESQTELAKKFTPGNSPSDNINAGCGCVILIILLLFFAMMFSSKNGEDVIVSIVIMFILLGACIYILKKFEKDIQQEQKQKEWEIKVKLYEEGWIVNRQVYLPVPSPSLFASLAINGLPVRL